MNKRYIDFVPKKKDGVKVVLPEAKPAPRGVTKASSVPTQQMPGPAVGAKRATKSISATNTSASRVSTSKVGAGGGSANRASSGTDRASTRGVVAHGAAKSPTSTARLGVIELRPKFVKTEVEKRPLSAARRPSSDATAAKAKRIAKVPLIGKKPSLIKHQDDTAVRRAQLERRRRAAAQADEILAEALEKAAGVDDERTLKVPRALKPPRKSPFVNVEKVVKRPLSRNVYQRKPVAPPREEPSAPVKIIDKPAKDSKVNLIVTIIITIILGAAAGTVAFLLLPK